jgi:hypothetical protein
MRFNGLSSRFGNTVLIWEHEINDIMETQDTKFEWYVQDVHQKTYTMQSVIQALYKGFYKERYASRQGGQKFYIISVKNLVEVE